MKSTTTKELKTTSTEIKIANRVGVEQMRSSSYHSTYLMSPASGYRSESVYNTSVGGLYGPGSRPERLTSDRRSLSGSSLSAAVSIRDSREREKKEISDLNDRLASYIEKVRFLDAQNRKMNNDLELFRARMGKDTLSTKAMYEGEIAEARKLIAATEVERGELEKQIPKLQAEITEYRKKYDDALRGHDVDKKKIDDLIVNFTGIENESNLLRRRIAELEGEVGELKKINVTDNSNFTRTRTAIDQESLSRIDFQNKAQMMLEEIEFIRREHDQELSDLHAVAARDTTSENREYFKNELASAIRTIRGDYDQIMAGHRSDIESWYHLKVQEICTASNRQTLERGYAKEEVKRLRNQLTDLRTRLADFEGRNSLLEKQVGDLNFQMEDEQKTYEFTLKERDEQTRRVREECEALMLELQNLLDTKQTLEAEIVQYRKLLEGEESRAGLRRLAQQVKTSEISVTDGGSHSSIVESSEKTSKEMGETTSKIHYHATAKGNLSIQDASVDGKFIVIENTSPTKEENIGEWQIKRSADNGPEVVFTFPKGFILKPLKTVKIWARDQGGEDKPPDQLVFEKEDSFGFGSNAKTVLINASGEERASHLQTTTQSTVIYA
uniref:Cytoplasmic intermediate filament protein n=1 Tax=Ascaris lumbricoides TaxID=6252 RepID=A0A0M3IC60_ASCLU